MTEPRMPEKGGVEDKWTKRLATRWVPVSSFFLANYTRLTPPTHKKLTPTQVLLVIQILDFKWSKAAPFPSVAKLCQRTGLTDRAVRLALKGLEEAGLLKKAPAPHGTNAYFFDGLYEKLEAIMDADQRALENTSGAPEAPPLSAPPFPPTEEAA